MFGEVLVLPILGTQFWLGLFVWLKRRLWWYLGSGCWNPRQQLFAKISQRFGVLGISGEIRPLVGIGCGFVKFFLAIFVADVAPIFLAQ